MSNQYLKHLPLFLRKLIVQPIGYGIYPPWNKSKHYKDGIPIPEFTKTQQGFYLRTFHFDAFSQAYSK